MADEVRFFTESYTHKTDAVATSSGGNDVGGHEPEYSIDYDMDTYWENDAALPVLKIDFGAAYTVDSLWFKQDNIDTFTLYYSTDDVAYNPVVGGTSGGSGAYKWLLAFTSQSARYWRINVTAKVGGGNTKVYDVLLMELRLALTAYENLPSMVHVIPKDQSGGGYPMGDGSYTTYAGERLFNEVDMEFETLPQAARDNLHSLYSTPDIRTPLVVFPNPDDYPGGIYRVLWNGTDFPLVYQDSYRGVGFKGKLSFREY